MSTQAPRPDGHGRTVNHSTETTCRKESPLSGSWKAARTRRRHRLSPAYADPWSFRRGRRKEGVANLWGQPCAADYCLAGGHLTVMPFDATLRIELPAQEPDAEEVRRWLHDRIVETVYEYERSERLTDKELFVIHRLWIDGWSLRRVAAVEGVTPQAIRERIEGNKQGHGGLKKKAPEFYQWWECKNKGRRNK